MSRKFSRFSGGVDSKILINLGAADGYYVNGWLRLNSENSAYAFEMDQESQLIIEEIARINCVRDRLNIFGKATTNFLELLPDDLDYKDVIVICDIEGSEYEIFNEENMTKLRDSILVIKVHDFDEDAELLLSSLIDLADRLLFKKQLLITRGRDFSPFYEYLDLDDVHRWMIAPEGRGRMSGKWLYLSPAIHQGNTEP
jgi:hypothetical protein